MRILVLDDDPRRQAKFQRHYEARAGHVVVQVWTHDAAVEALLKARFDLIHLDHDLNDYVVRSTVQETGGVRELTGLDVARFIMTLTGDETGRPEVIVHSWNPLGARTMVALLREHGFPVVYRPFAELGAPELLEPEQDPQARLEELAARIDAALDEAMEEVDLVTAREGAGS
jgi:CheY-like chemotaxis protein